MSRSTSQVTRMPSVCWISCGRSVSCRVSPILHTSWVIHWTWLLPGLISLIRRSSLIYHKCLTTLSCDSKFLSSVRRSSSSTSAHALGKVFTRSDSVLIYEVVVFVTRGSTKRCRLTRFRTSMIQPYRLSWTNTLPVVLPSGAISHSLRGLILNALPRSVNPECLSEGTEDHGILTIACFGSTKCDPLTISTNASRISTGRRGSRTVVGIPKNYGEHCPEYLVMIKTTPFRPRT